MTLADESTADRPTSASDWEYETLSIPLDLSTPDFPDERHPARRAERIVGLRVAREAADGWEPDGPLTRGALRRAGRLRRRQTAPCSARGLFRAAYAYEDVAVRLRRPARRSS